MTSERLEGHRSAVSLTQHFFPSCSACFIFSSQLLIQLLYQIHHIGLTSHFHISTRQETQFPEIVIISIFAGGLYHKAVFHRSIRA